MEVREQCCKSNNARARKVLIPLSGSEGEREQI